MIGGRALYVATNGKDTNDGSSVNPYETIPYAVSQLAAGDTLYVREGLYRQANRGAVFESSGAAGRNITVQGIGTVLIQGPNTATYDGLTVASNPYPAFDTNGHDYIVFKNFAVSNLRSAIKVNTHSSFVNIDGIDSDRNHFGVWIHGADHTSVANMTITNSRYGVLTDANEGVIPTNLLFENMNVSGSKDVYPSWKSGYRNGDGFILNAGGNITIRNVKSHDNWEAGFDIKADNVTLDSVESFDNRHQGVKIWGSGIVFTNSVIRDTLSTPDDPVSPDGFGVNNRGGRVIFINSTFSNNFAADIVTADAVGVPSTVLYNCIIARNLSHGHVINMLWKNTGVSRGTFIEKNNIWFDAVKRQAGFILDLTSRFANPDFVDWGAGDFHLKPGSPAIDFGSISISSGLSDFDGKSRLASGRPDAGAFEFG